MSNIIIINGAMGSGRTYLQAILLLLAQRLDVLRVSDIYPDSITNSTHIDSFKYIYSNHLSNVPAFAHKPYSRYKECIESGVVRFVYLYRDPREMILSILRHHKYCYNPVYAQAQRIFSQDATDRDSFVRLLKNGDEVYFMKYHEFSDDIRWFVKYPYSYLIRYEDLVAAPVVVVKNLLSLIGVTVGYQDLSEVVQKIRRTGKLGEWRTFFDDNLEAIFKECAGDIVSYLGYETDESWSFRS